MNNSLRSEKRSTDDELLKLLSDEFADRARRDLLAFTVYTKPDYEVNWHHRVLCERLNAFARGEIKRLMVSMPPRHGKSELVSRRLPAFIFGINPDAQIISASYGSELASRMNRDVQRIIDENSYKELFPGTTLFGENVRTISQGSYLRNSDIFEIVGRKGVYRCSGVGGGITGMGADFGIIDDPIKNQEEADSTTYRQKLWEWYTSTLYTRLEKGGSLLLTMTRWHDDDLAARLLKLANEIAGGEAWEVLEFPAIKEERTVGPDFRDIGEPLWSSKYDTDRLKKIQVSVGSRVWNALYQQRPAPAEGAMVKFSWLTKTYKVLPARMDAVLQSWDLAFKGSERSDFVVGLILGRCGGDFYLYPNRVRARMNFPETVSAFRAFSAANPKAVKKVVEAKANGQALIDSLTREITGIVPYVPTGKKEERLAAVSPIMEAGNFYLPDPSIAPWVQEYIDELTTFPMAANDDQVDATTQGLALLIQKTATNWSPMSVTSASKWRKF